MPPTEEGTRPFIGRAEILDELRARLGTARQGQGGFTWIFGDVGVGKSFLAQEFAREARSAPMEVLSGRAPALENPPPLHLISQALQHLGSEEDASGRGAFRPSALAFVPAAGADPVLLGFVPRMEGPGGEPDRFDDRLLEQMVAPSFSGEGGTSWVFSQLSDRLLSHAASHPVLLILEDLQTADAPSLEFLGYLAPLIEDHPLWVVATLLPRPSLSELVKLTLERVGRATRTEEITLRPFTAPELAEFVRTLDGEYRMRPEEITRWHSQTGGNPLFVEQIVRSRRERGAGRSTPEPSIREMTEFLAQQMAELTEEEQRAVTVAAVLGKEFSFPFLLRASGEPEERLAEITERLSSRGILREQPDERFEFVRDDLRLQIYSDLTETRRRLLHRRAAEALEATGTADAATIYALARHFQLGRVEDKSALYNRLAGDFAARSFTPEVARDHYSRALDSLRLATPYDAEGELELMIELAIQLDRVGELQAAERCLRDVLARPKLVEIARPTQKALLHLSLARILYDQGRMDDANHLTMDLLARYDPEAGPIPLIAIHRIRGEVLYYLGLYEESLNQTDEALAIARTQHNAREIALATQRRANVLGMIPGRFAEAVAAGRLAAEELERQGDLGEAAYARMFLGVLMSQHDRVDEGLQELEAAVRLAENAHDQRRIGWALFNLADLLRETGQVSEARARNGRARQILEHVGDRFGLIQSRIIEGKILLGLGETSDAEVELLEAYRLSRELNTPADEIDVVLRLAEVALARNDRAMVQSRIGELERMGLARLRPDLEPEFDRLKARLEESVPVRAP